MNDIAQLRQRNADLFDQLVADLSELVAIPGISSQPEHKEDLDRSAQFVADLFAAEGAEVEILTAPTDAGHEGHPAVVARIHDRPGQPTVLLYAHHDVQPVGAGWDTEPFTATRVGDRLFGRGAADDGAGIAVHLGAIRLLGADRNVNVTVYIEGEEEFGSPSFANFVKKYHDKLAADVIVVADSTNWDEGKPAVTTSLRGSIKAHVTVSVVDHQLHSGMYGGPLLDAITLASRLVATLHDDQGNVAIKGLHGSEDVSVDYTEEEFRATAGVLDGVQLAGTGPITSRLWNKPAISVIGWDQRSLANASNTLTASTTLCLSMRVAPGQDVREGYELLRQHLLDHAPFGAKVEVKLWQSGPSYLAQETPTLEHLENALAAAFEVEPVHTGQGGSIPFISEFEKEFPDADVLVTGVEDPYSNAHSENESVYLPDLERNVLAHALLLNRIGAK